MQLNTTQNLEDRKTPSKEHYKYYRNLVEIPIYKYTYQLTRFLVHITSNAPKNLTHIAEKVQTEALNLSTLFYMFYASKHKVPDKEKREQTLKELEIKLSLLAFHSKLLYDIKIISKSQNTELMDYIGFLNDEYAKLK